MSALSVQLIIIKDGMKGRSGGKELMMSRRREQSSKTRYFLKSQYRLKPTDGSQIATYFSISSVVSPNGKHSKMMSPGCDSADASLVGDIAKTVSESHFPEFGTSNFCSNHIAVPSLSGFMHSQTCQHAEFLGSIAGIDARGQMRLRIVSTKEPFAHRRSCSFLF